MEEAADEAAKDNGLSDWAIDEYPEDSFAEHMDFETHGYEAVTSDWENLGDDELEIEKEITEEGFRLMKELENEMILDGLLETDDLLGEELMEAKQEDGDGEEASEERTMTEHVVPITHPSAPALASSQSPSSKRLRLPSGEGRSSGTRSGGPTIVVESPLMQEIESGLPISQQKRLSPKKLLLKAPWLERCLQGS